jgi:hypothetical protein
MAEQFAGNVHDGKVSLKALAKDFHFPIVLALFAKLLHFQPPF